MDCEWLGQDKFSQKDFANLGSMMFRVRRVRLFFWFNFSTMRVVKKKVDKGQLRARSYHGDNQLGLSTRQHDFPSSEYIFPNRTESLPRETPNRVQSAEPVLRLSYLKIFDDSRYSINTNRKIIPHNRYLHTFSSVTRNISHLSGIYKIFFVFLQKLKIAYKSQTEGKIHDWLNWKYVDTYFEVN